MGGNNNYIIDFNIMGQTNIRTGKDRLIRLEGAGQQDETGTTGTDHQWIGNHRLPGDHAYSAEMLIRLYINQTTLRALLTSNNLVVGGLKENQMKRWLLHDQRPTKAIRYDARSSQPHKELSRTERVCTVSVWFQRYCYRGACCQHNSAA